MAVAKISKSRAKNIWIHAQKLDLAQPFGAGPDAVTKAVQHLGYVQIDTISVIERCHHHIFYNRIPHYKKSDLHQAQTIEKSVFEYWTHALAYVPTADYKYFIARMNKERTAPNGWYASVTANDYKKVKTLLKQTGPTSIRDIKDDVLVEKTHAWGSTKPSKKALQLGFTNGEFVISERVGMLKKYDLAERHFGWKTKPKAVSENVYATYALERALRSQGLVSLDSICYLHAKLKPAVQKIIEVKKLVEVKIEGSGVLHWTRPEIIEEAVVANELTHILSPFDPLTIQRKRLKLFFDYEHLFEGYINPEKRKYGYFALPILLGNEIVAVLDLKTDRAHKKLLIQRWTWLKKFKSKTTKALIETELERFERFQVKED